MKDSETIDYSSKEYWFHNPIHDEMHNYGEKYYANVIFKNLINKLSLPEGYVIVLGANRGVSLDLLIDRFGSDRVIGYDVYNPSNHPNIRVKNVMDLEDADNIPLAFVHNDVGSYPTTPVEKSFAQMWAAKNVVSGGFLLGRNNLNSAKAKNEEDLEAMSFKNHQFSDLQHFFNLSELNYSEIEGHMLSRRD
jgi:hypothetical protein